MQENCFWRMKFKFVGMGTEAPDPVPQNEVWLDVGNRLDARVLDHHIGGAPSSTQLVLARIQDLIVPYVNLNSPLCMVIHSHPDLDSICSSWLVKKHLIDRIDILTNPYVQEIVRMVSDNDQGLIRTTDPLHCWPIIIRTLVGKASENNLEKEIYEKYFPLFEQTLDTLSKGGSLADAANRILTPELRIALSLEKRDYQYDFPNGTTFQVRLPLHSSYSGDDAASQKGGVHKERRILVDGLFLQNPTSDLFKELARSDRENSPLKQGFPFLVIAEDVPLQDGRVFQRFVISVDPLTGLHLKGLGELLEAREQEKEDELNAPLLPGRERVQLGMGRFGGIVMSPWYDGRGHHFTIIDSPDHKIDADRDVCFSQLNSEEVLDTVWRYADPALFVDVRSAVQIVFTNCDSKSANESQGESVSLRDSIISMTDRQCRWGSAIKHLTEMCGLSDHPGAVPGKRWDFFNSVSIVAQKNNLSEKEAGSLHQVVDSFSAKPAHETDGAGPVPVSNRSDQAPTSLLVVDIAENHFFQLREFNPLLLSFYWMVIGKRSHFPSSQERDDCNRHVQLVSPDRRMIFLVFPWGNVLVRSLAEKKGPMFSEPFEFLVALAMSASNELDNLSEKILEHLRIGIPAKLGKTLQQDRMKLFKFQQSVMIEYACEDRFIQQVHETLQGQWMIAKKFEQEAQRVNSLAQSFREASDALAAKLSFIVTTAIAPLLLTLTFFNGTFMETDFQSKYRTFIPSKLILWLDRALHVGQGWSAFILVFCVFTLFFVAIWAAITRLGRGRKPK